MKRHNAVDDDGSASNIQMLEYKSIWDDFGVTFFLRSVRTHRRLMLLIPVFWLLISNVWFLTAQTRYQGVLQLIPASTGLASAKTSGLGGLLSGSGLSGLLGDNTNDPMFSVYIESWSAPWFAADLAANQDLTKRMFPERWSVATNNWKPVSNGVGHWVRILFGAREYRSSVPDTEDALAYLTEHVSIQRNRTGIMTKVTFESRDQRLVRDLLNFGHSSITDHMRLIYQKRAQDSINYIVNELQHVTVSEYRTALIDDLAQQEKIRMMAYANKQFVAQSLGTYVTTSPVWPRGMTVIVSSLFISLLIYSVCVIVAGKPALTAKLRTLTSQFAPSKTDTE